MQSLQILIMLSILVTLGSAQSYDPITLYPAGTTDHTAETTASHGGVTVVNNGLIGSGNIVCKFYYNYVDNVKVYTGKVKVEFKSDADGTVEGLNSDDSLKLNGGNKVTADADGCTDIDINGRDNEVTLNGSDNEANAEGTNFGTPDSGTMTVNGDSNTITKGNGDIVITTNGTGNTIY